MGDSRRRAGDDAASLFAAPAPGPLERIPLASLDEANARLGLALSLLYLVLASISWSSSRSLRLVGRLVRTAPR